TLYADISSRHPVRDIISVLGESPDRDVRYPVADFYAPVPRGWGDEADDGSASTSNSAAAQAHVQPAHPALERAVSSSAGEDSLMSDPGGDDDDDNVPNPFSPSRAAAAAAVPLPGRAAAATPPSASADPTQDSEQDDFDVDMAELDDAEPVLLERPAPESPVLGGGGDDDFVEVERASEA
ncbi:hypothetical protein JCM3775_006822, partial [Rhodotorula graminis]